MKIVISGGWGYRNLGDDAILASTIELLQIKYPDCHIDVLTYDTDDSKVHKSASVDLHRCAHAYIDFNVCEYRYPIINKDYSIPKKIYYKLADPVIESKWWFDYQVRKGSLSKLETLIRNADLFIMAGGGYFNEKWMAKVRSHLWELETAHKHQVPFYIIGPTIGTFPAQMTAEISKVFMAAQRISVRDDSSFSEVSRYRSDLTLIPDIALSTWLDTPQKFSVDTIGITFTNNSPKLQANLVAALSGFVAQHPDWRIKLFISRRWKYDFANAMKLQRQLFDKGIDAEIVFSASYHRLEEGLAACKLVISENLHGLILAARNLVPVIAINDYPVGSPNYKKFIAFLKQSNSDSNFINEQKSIQDIVELFNLVLSEMNTKKVELQGLRLKVREQNIAFL